MSDFARTLGGHIRQVRGAMSQAEFAAKIGINKNLLGKYERGESVPGGEMLSQIHDATGVSIDWLLTGEGEMRPGSAVTEQAAREAQPAEVDPDLVGEISELVSGVYLDCGLPVILRQVVAEATRIAQDVSGPDYTDADRPGAIRYAIAQLRRQLLVANTPAGMASDKSSA